NGQAQRRKLTDRFNPCLLGHQTVLRDNRLPHQLAQTGTSMCRQPREAIMQSRREEDGCLLRTLHIHLHTHRLLRGAAATRAPRADSALMAFAMRAQKALAALLSVDTIKAWPD